NRASNVAQEVALCRLFVARMIGSSSEVAERAHLVGGIIGIPPGTWRCCFLAGTTLHLAIRHVTHKEIPVALTAKAPHTECDSTCVDTKVNWAGFLLRCPQDGELDMLVGGQLCNLDRVSLIQFT